MTNITLICASCGLQFEKREAEAQRQLRRNPERQFYCKLTCYGRTVGKTNLGGFLGHGDASLLNPRNRKDELSPFRWYMARIRQREHEADVTLEDLKSLWEQQQGMCSLSGLKMLLPATTAAHDTGQRNPWKASLDRIDPQKGYVHGNVRFVVAMANLCRNRFTDDDVRRFCKAVVDQTG